MSYDSSMMVVGNFIGHILEDIFEFINNFLGGYIAYAVVISAALLVIYILYFVRKVMHDAV